MPCASRASSPKLEGRLVAAAGDGAAVLHVDLAFGNAEAACGERDHLLFHVVARDHRRASGVDRLPAGEGADALADGIGVAERHHDVGDRTAEPVGDDLRQRRMGALPLGGRAGRHRDLAVAQDAHGDAFERPEPGAFHVIADADADMAPGGARGRLARREAGIVGKGHGARLAQREIAARIDQRLAVAEYEADPVRHLFRRDHVAAAQFGAVDGEFARHPVHQALHGEHRLRPAGAAHHRGRHPVGEDDRGLELECRYHIGSGKGGRGDIGRDDSPWQVGAVVVDHFPAQSSDFPVGIDGDGDLPILVALLGRGQEMLAPVLDPFHRTAEPQRGDRDDDLLGIERRLGTEAAADERCDDADVLEVAVEQVGNGGTAEMRCLRRRPHRQPAGRRFLARQHGAALQRHRGAAMLENLLLEHMGRGGEGVFHVAIGHGDEGGDIGGEIAVAARRARGQRVAAIAGSGKHLVVDRDGCGGILGEIAVVGDDHGDGFADIADLIAGERMLGAQRRDGGIGHRHRQRLGRELSGQVVRREHRMDAGHRQRRRRVDCADTGMGMRAPHEGCMQRARQLHVVDEARPPGEQSGVFDPRHPGAELPRAHDSGPRTPVGGDVGGMTGGRSGIHREFGSGRGCSRAKCLEWLRGAIRCAFISGPDSKDVFMRAYAAANSTSRPACRSPCGRSNASSTCRSHGMPSSCRDRSSALDPAARQSKSEFGKPTAERVRPRRLVHKNGNPGETTCRERATRRATHASRVARRLCSLAPLAGRGSG